MSMTNDHSNSSSPSPPRTPPAAASMLTRIHDCRSRDENVKAALDVIHCKMADLQYMGVQCGFCYLPPPSRASDGTTTSLYTSGNKAITQVIEEARYAILDSISREADTPGKSRNLSDKIPSLNDDHNKVDTLPQTRSINDLNSSELCNLIVGTLNGMGVKWTDSRPAFWPDNVPFRYPGTAPEGFHGCWTSVLRDIVQSMYSYFSGYRYHGNKPSNTGDNGDEQTQGDNPVPPTDNEFTDDEEDEEIDVVNEPSSFEHTPMMSRVNNPAPSIPLDTYMAHLQYPSNRSHDHRSHGEEDTCSSTDEDNTPLSTVNYFGYELARGESLQASPALSSGSSNGGQQHDTSSSPRPHPSPLLLCAPPPHVYPYPIQIPAPFILQPNLLPKIFTTASATDTPTQSTIATSPLLKSPIPPNYTALTRPHNATPTLPSTNAFLAPSIPQSLISASKDNNNTTTTTNGKDMPSVMKTSSSTMQHQQETKNKRGRNHGMYIYTTPTEPLKFMSLSKSSTPSTTTNSKFTYNTRKMAAMTTVAPPTRSNGSKITTESTTKLLRNSIVESKHYKTQQATPTQSAIQTLKTAHIKGIKHSTTINALQNKTPPTLLAGDMKPKKAQGNMKRKRELVFHWYNSPDPIPQPPSKRMNSAGTV